MNNNLRGIVAFAALAAAASAQADVKWTVVNAGFYGGVVINGYFTEAANSTVVDYSLSATGGDTFTFDPGDSSVTSVGSTSVNFQGNNNDIISLVFSDTLDVANNPLSMGSAFIYYGGPGSHTFGYTDGTGSATGQTLAVPEPAAWASMLGGVFGVGAMLRRRRVTLAA